MTDTTEIRLPSGAMGRIWEISLGNYGWAHPNGSEGTSHSFRSAEDDLNATDLAEELAQLRAVNAELAEAAQYAQEKLALIPAFRDTIGVYVTKAELGIAHNKLTQALSRSTGAQPCA